MLVVMSFGCYLAVVNFRRDRGGSAIAGRRNSSERRQFPRVLWSGRVCPLVAELLRRNDHAVECFGC